MQFTLNLTERIKNSIKSRKSKKKMSYGKFSIYLLIKIDLINRETKHLNGHLKPNMKHFSPSFITLSSSLILWSTISNDQRGSSAANLHLAGVANENGKQKGVTFEGYSESEVNQQHWFPPSPNEDRFLLHFPHWSLASTLGSEQI